MDASKKNRTHSGQQRNLMVVDLYRKKIGNRPFTLNEVADWAICEDIVPVPVRGSSTREEVVAWEARYDAAEDRLVTEANKLGGTHSEAK